MAKEVPVALEVAGVRLEGRADRVGADWVLDHQTDQEVDLEAYRLQVMVYAWALGKPRAYVADLRKGKAILVAKNPKEEARLRQRITMVLEQVMGMGEAGGGPELPKHT